MKKVLIGVSVFLLVLVVGAIAIPFFVNVDQYRPEIEKVAAENMNGKLKLGKLGLTLWGKVNVSIDGLEIQDQNDKKVLAVKDASFEIPFASVLSGSPILTLVMNAPEIIVVKTADGKMNLMGLMKQKPASTEPTDPKADKADQKSTDANTDSNSAKLPSIVLKARLGVDVSNASIQYLDDTTKLKTTLNDVNLRIKDFSLSRKTQIEFWANLDTKMGTDLTVKGPLRFTMSLDPKIEGNEVVGGALEARFSADELDLRKGNLFHKKSGIPANVQVNLALSPAQFELKDSRIQFHNAVLSIKGTVTKEMSANITVDTQPIDLKPWSELVPMLNEFELAGQLHLDASARGKAESLQYAAKVEVKDLSFKGPNLKAKPVIYTLVEVQTDRVEKLLTRMTAPGTELVFQSRIVSFKKPTITFDLTSKGMDLDQWVEFPQPKKEETKVAAKSESTTSSQSTAPAEDLDAMLDPMRENQALKDLTLDGKIALAFVKAKNAKIDDIKGKVTFKNLKFGFSDFGLKAFGGSVSGMFASDFLPKQPTYSMKLNVANIAIEKAVESQFQSFKNTMLGKISFNMEASGKSFNAEPAKKNLVAKGGFKVEDGKFASMDIAKMANEGLSGALQKVGDKVPALKGKTLKVPGNREGKYKLISSSFTIQNGVLNAPDFVGQSYPGSSVDFKGSTKMGLIDETLDANWEIIDTHRVTGADGLNVEISGVQIKNVLAKGENDPVIIPIKIGCKWVTPCPSYTEAPEYLAGVAAGRVSKAAGSAVKQKAQEVIQTKGKEILQQAPANIKKLFGR